MSSQLNQPENKNKLSLMKNGLQAMGEARAGRQLRGTSCSHECCCLVLRWVSWWRRSLVESKGVGEERGAAVVCFVMHPVVNEVDKQIQTMTHIEMPSQV
jgi:hypothetical protein